MSLLWVAEGKASHNSLNLYAACIRYYEEWEAGMGQGQRRAFPAVPMYNHTLFFFFMAYMSCTREENSPIKDIKWRERKEGMEKEQGQAGRQGRQEEGGDGGSRLSPLSTSKHSKSRESMRQLKQSSFLPIYMLAFPCLPAPLLLLLFPTVYVCDSHFYLFTFLTVKKLWHGSWWHPSGGMVKTVTGGWSVRHQTTGRALPGKETWHGMGRHGMA